MVSIVKIAVNVYKLQPNISKFMLECVIVSLFLMFFKGEKYVERHNFFVVFQRFKPVFIEDTNVMDIKIAKWEKMRTLKCVVSGFHF